MCSSFYLEKNGCEVIVILVFWYFKFKNSYFIKVDNLIKSNVF